MSRLFSGSELSRREALAVLGSAGIGLAMTGLNLGTNEPRPPTVDEALKNFSAASRTVLSHLLHDPNFGGKISAAHAAALAKNENIPFDKLMVGLLPVAQTYSRAPISNFYVGVVVKGESGSLYTGANIEIPGQCLGFAVHGEQSALANAYMHEEKSVTALAVNGAPCGHCRQFIEEMSPDGEILIIAPKSAPTKLSSILPNAFGPSALGMTHGALPVPNIALSPSGFSGNPVVLAALNAARKSYAPYSKSPSGAALQTTSRVYSGSYIENVAFNPSLSPLQVALAALIAGGEDYSSISGAALVEAQGAKITQRPVTETVLGTIAPSAKLLYMTAPY